MYIIDGNNISYYEQEIRPIMEKIKPRTGSVYLAKDNEDAIKYKNIHGGIIFHEQGTEIYRVFPESFKDYVGVVYNMEEE